MIKDLEDIVVQDFVIPLVAGEDLVENDSVYIDASDGKAYKTDADDLAKIGFAGFVVDDTTATNTVYIRTYGIKTGFSSLTIGGQVWVSGTAGAVTQTKPTNYKLIGVAKTATIIEITKELTKRVRVYTSSDTWVKPAGLMRLIVEVQAAGGTGGGGSGSDWGAAGGGSGGYAKKDVDVSLLASSETITIGATTSFTVTSGTNISCTVGSAASGTTAGAGGTATGGDINIAGNYGGFGKSGAGSEISGSGADSFLGIGGGGRSSSGSGHAASGYGAGGGGAINTGSSASYSGGAGTAGVVIVTEYY